MAFQYDWWVDGEFSSMRFDYVGLSGIASYTLATNAIGMYGWWLRSIVTDIRFSHPYLDCGANHTGAGSGFGI